MSNYKLHIDTTQRVHDDEDLGLANDANGNAPNVPSLWGIPLKYIS